MANVRNTASSPYRDRLGLINFDAFATYSKSYSARTCALFEKGALHRVARKGERCSKVRTGSLVSPAAQLKFAKRSFVKRICGQAVAIRNRAYCRKATFGAIALCNRNGAIQFDNWRRSYRH